MCNSFVTTGSVTKKICNKVVCNKGAKNRLMNFLAARIECYKVFASSFSFSQKLQLGWHGMANFDTDKAEPANGLF